jgi:hypothetical protein
MRFSRDACGPRRLVEEGSVRGRAASESAGLVRHGAVGATFPTTAFPTTAFLMTAFPESDRNISPRSVAINDNAR